MCSPTSYGVVWWWAVLLSEHYFPTPFILWQNWFVLCVWYNLGVSFFCNWWRRGYLADYFISAIILVWCVLVYLISFFFRLQPIPCLRWAGERFSSQFIQERSRLIMDLPIKGVTLSTLLLNLANCENWLYAVLPYLRGSAFTIDLRTIITIL